MISNSDKVEALDMAALRAAHAKLLDASGDIEDCMRQYVIDLSYIQGLISECVAMIYEEIRTRS